MPFQPILPTWIALNGGTLTSPTGLTDSRTGQPFAAGGLNIGDYFDLTQQEALQLSNTGVGTLLSGRYRFVQLDSGATVANIAVGTIGLMRSLIGGSYAGPMNYVTTADQANNYLSLNNARKVVFLCAVTAGQSLTQGVFAFVQELGLATVQLKTPITNAGSAKVGDGIIVTSNGQGDDPVQPPVVLSIPLLVGVSASLPASGALCTVELTSPVFQG